MRFIQNTRKTKCKRCGESKLCYKDTLKGVNVCSECLETYKKASITCSSCKTRFKRQNEFISEDNSLMKTNSFCSESCYNNFKNEQEEKDKMDEWLKKYFKVDKLPSRIYMQMEDFKKKKDISYKWTFATLRYVVNIKGEELQDGTIGIVPYVVDECRDYVKKLNEMKKNRKNSVFSRATFSGNLITIKTVDVHKKRKKLIENKTITEKDLEEVILW